MQADAADFPAEVTQAADLVLESKGHGVLILDLRGISTATDYFVLASGTSDVQVKAIAEHVVDELKKGDRIVTNGGLHGVILNLKDDIVLLNIADHVKVEVSRAAVSRVKNGDGKKS